MDRLDRYTCDEALRRLEDYLDRELTCAAPVGPASRPPSLADCEISSSAAIFRPT
jgi:hypothetical protein